MHLVTKFLLSAMAPEQFPSATAPGRTRAINFFALSDSATARLPRLLFADLPGYGYAKISRSISAEWPKFINPYLEERPNLVLCICLVDSNIPVQASDQQLIASLKGMGRSFLIVGTKADRLSGNERTKALKQLKQGLGLNEVLLCSAKTGAGLKELWAEILAIAQEKSSA
jgi:GTP-binding protein